MLVLDLLSTPALFVRALHHHVDPMSHHCIDQHVEDGWGQRVPLHHPPEYLERRPIVPLPAFANHPQPTPLCPEELESSRHHAVSLQDLQASGPVHGVTRLVQVHTYHLQDLLLQG